MTKDWRPVHGPRTIAALVPVVAKTAFSKGGHGVVHLLEAWSAIIGPELSGVTTPKRLSRGTLTIACSGPVAMELQHLAPQIIERINVHFGQTLVTRLRFAQDIGPAPLPPPRPSPKATEAARLAVQCLPEGRLRDALIGLGAHLLAKP